MYFVFLTIEEKYEIPTLERTDLSFITYSYVVRTTLNFPTRIWEAADLRMFGEPWQRDIVDNLAHCNVQYDSQVCFGNLCPTVMIHFSSQGLDAWSKWSWIFLCSKWSINFSCSFPLLSLQTSNPWWLKTTPTKVLLCIVTQGSVSRKFRWSFTTRKLLYVHNVYFKDWNFACFEIYAIKC